MSGLTSPARRRRRVAIDAAMVFVIVLLMTQMWLLTATLESYLAGHREAAGARYHGGAMAHAHAAGPGWI